MNRGYIKLWRKIRESTMWKEKPFSPGQAWIDLILQANHEDKEVFFHNRVEVCKRGQIITSILKLSEAWGWDWRRVKRWIENCKKMQNIQYNTRYKRFIVITICNYNLYQDKKETDGRRDGIRERHENAEEMVDKQEVKNTKKDIYSSSDEDSKALFQEWNSLGIIVHREYSKFEVYIKAKLKTFTRPKISEAMRNYKTILSSNEYYFTHRWTLKQFLTRDGGFDKFLTVNDPFSNYRKRELINSNAGQEKDCLTKSKQQEEEQRTEDELKERLRRTQQNAGRTPE